MTPKSRPARSRLSTLARATGVFVGLGLVIIASTLIWKRWAAEPVDQSDTRSQTQQRAPAPAVEADDQAVLPLKSQQSWGEIDDPTRDGWNLEARAEQAKQTLYQFGKLMVGSEAITPQAVDRLSDMNFAGQRLQPRPLERVFDDTVLYVDRWKGTENSPQQLQHRGRSGFEAVLREHADVWSKFEDKRFEFKVVHITQSDDGLETHQYVAVSGRDPAGSSIEQHAMWLTHWTIGDSNQLQLRSIRVADFERTTSKATESLFADCTESILGGNDSFRRQLLFGLDYWLERMQDMRYFAPLGNPGLAVGDVNNDGLDDLYVCQEANLPNRLFLQQKDGTAQEVSAQWQVDFLEGSRSALVVDLDNDSDQDLVVSVMGGLVIASNEQDHFVVRNVLATSDDTTSLTAADYDLDGDLDLYVCVDYPNDHFATSREATDGITIQGGAANRVYHDANNAGRNSLFRNDIAGTDEWHFRDVTEESGIDQNNRRFSWAACWEDYDNDGDQDLYVANDFGRNNLYSNHEGHFQDVAKTANAEDSAAGMSAAWADVNRDGKMDLYVANMFSSAGSRITEQPQFKQGVSREMKSRWRQFALGNTLMTNRGSSGFHDISQEAAVTLGRWSWSSNFVDINNDGWQDIVVANGYITSTDTSDL